MQANFYSKLPVQKIKFVPPYFHGFVFKKKQACNARKYKILTNLAFLCKGEKKLLLFLSLFFFFFFNSCIEDKSDVTNGNIAPITEYSAKL